MEHILLFAGTTEGRELASEILKGKYPVELSVCTATEYGKECVIQGLSSDTVDIMAGRMDQKEMAELMGRKKTALVIDATHPFARDVTKNIQSAAKEAGVEYRRLLRGNSERGEEVILTDSVEEAAEYLAGTTGNILITTGSKELDCYTSIPDYKERCYARVLSTEEAVVKSIRLGFEGAHLFAMQGPFSKEMNLAVLHQTKAAYFVTKESGTEGGYREKLWAAREADAALLVVRRPKETGVGLEEMKRYLERRYRC